MKPRPYELTRDFEIALAVAVCSRAQLYRQLGALIDTQCLALPEAQLAIRAARARHEETTLLPESPVVVVQHIRRWVGEGSVTHAQLAAVEAMFDYVEDTNRALSSEAIVATMAPLLRRAMELVTIEKANKLWETRKDASAALRELDKAASIGKQDRTLGNLLNLDARSRIDSLRRVERLAIGIVDLDDALKGGFVLPSLAAFLGATNAGKSVVLPQVAASAALQGLFAAYATLELPTIFVEARLVANLSGEGIDGILDDPCGSEGSKAFERLERLRACAGFGGIVVKAFPSRATSIVDFDEWLRAEEQTHGRRVDVLVVDYADKCAPRARTGKDEANPYRAIGEVYQELVDYAKETMRWVVTASQAKGGATRSSTGKKRRLTNDDCADSIGKARVANYLIGINRDEEQNQVSFGVEKNTYGPAGALIGPLQSEFWRARIAQVVEDREGVQVGTLFVRMAGAAE